MIVIEAGKFRHDTKDTPHYHCPLGALTSYGGLCWDFNKQEYADLRKLRAEYATLQQEFVEFQKFFGKEGDKETAKFFKEEARRMLKHTRACTLILNWAEGTDGTRPRHWPLELNDELDFISYRISK